MVKYSNMWYTYESVTGGKSNAGSGLPPYTARVVACSRVRVWPVPGALLRVVPFYHHARGYERH